MVDSAVDGSLQLETRWRYLNYALSVITSRALPDVRDGLKPVQRRILYAMHHDEHLGPQAKHRKSAKVVGSVIGKYHPHGDTAVYDAMVRMAQDFSLRDPLVDGSGNFGSLDGDGAAAYRYTECRLTAIALEMLTELKQDTVPYRDNFDATTQEPIVLPSRFPNLLVNGSTGIAVGMATNIPPHNLKEVVTALIALIENPDLTTTNILKHIKGPDFPTGGQVLNTKVELRKIYDSGHGAIRVRGQYQIEKTKKYNQIIITSIPYPVTKASIVEKIADVIIRKKVPQLLDVRDESTTDVRIVLEAKTNADPDIIMAYLFKNTPMQLNFNLNMTCLLPTNSDVGTPQRVGLKTTLTAFLDFRFAVTKKRFEYDLAALLHRIHILEGFVAIFDALDETIRIVRKSEGKQDAAKKIMKKFGLDEIQTDAILELRLYKLAKLEILVIREELEKKTKEARRIQSILKSKKKMWGVIQSELEGIRDTYGTPRRTLVSGKVEEVEIDENAFVVDEDAHVIVSKDGWIRRVREIKDVSKLRVREGDYVLAILQGSTKENVILFSNLGTAYTAKINDIVATTGYGEPISKLFKLKDGERILTAISTDERTLPPTEAIAVSAMGYSSRFELTPLLEKTTKAGRRYAKPGKNNAIVGVAGCGKKDIVVAATHQGHVAYTKTKEINLLENPGKGVLLMKVNPKDTIVGFACGRGKSASLIVETTKGGKKTTLYPDPKKAKARGGKGYALVKRGTLRVAKPIVTIIPLANARGNQEVH